MKNPLATRMALLILIVAAAGCSHSKANSLTVTIQPSAVSIAPGETVAFEVLVTGPVDAPIVWSVKEGPEGGIVSKEGVYTAPASPGLFHVIAMVTGQNQTAVFATAEVTVRNEIRDGVSPGDGGPGSGSEDASAGARDVSVARETGAARDTGVVRDTRVVRDTGAGRDTGSAVAPTGSVSRDSKGWTVVTRAADAKVIYVSSSSGNDNNEGSTEDAPLKTIAAGVQKMRSGFPDWLRLKAGDTWKESFREVTPGRSADEPVLIFSYGQGARPRIMPVGETGFWNLRGQHIYLIGLEFYNPERDPSSPSFKDGVASAEGITLIDSGDILIEDCLFRYLSGGLNIQGDKSGSDRIQIRRNVILDMYTHDAHVAGSYFQKVSNLLIEENVFDHNGWIVDPKVKPNAHNSPNVFNHDVYLSGNFDHVVIRGNWFSRSGSLSLKFVNYDPKPNFSSDVVVDNNFFFEGEIGIAASREVDGDAPSEPSFTGFTIQNNVLLQIDRDNPTKRGLGWGMELKNLGNSTVRGNVFSDFSLCESTFGIQLTSPSEADVQTGLVVEGNTFYGIREQAIIVAPAANWRDVKVINNTFQDPTLGAAMIAHKGSFSKGIVEYRGNTYFASNPSNFALVSGRAVTYEQWVSQSGETESKVQAVAYSDPGRNLETYAKKEGLGADEQVLQKLLDRVRGQSKSTWAAGAEATKVNNYIREGFDLKTVH